MRGWRLAAGVGVGVLTGVAWLMVNVAPPPTPARPLPLWFEPNHGQANSQAKFLYRGPHYTLYLTETGPVVAASGAPGAVRMKLHGANPEATLRGLEERPGRSHYFLGNDPARWRSNVPHFGRVIYESVWPGVDLVFHGDQRRLEFDFVVAPGGDPNVVDLSWEGAATPRLEGGGDLALPVAGGEWRLRRPLVYQRTSNGRRRIGGRFRVGEDRHIRFGVASYDASLPLILDPVVEYSTYFGGGDRDTPWAVAVDAAGNTYVAGVTYSRDLPVASPMQSGRSGVNDAFVLKLHPAGDVAFATYLGGNCFDEAHDLALDPAGNVYVVGWTCSSDFPTAAPLQAALRSSRNGFLAKLDPNGSTLRYSTYLGGTGRGATGADEIRAVAVDAAGNVYLTGYTESSDFPTRTPLQASSGGGRDAFVAKVNPSGAAFVYSTYLGGSGRDDGYDIAIDAAGNAYVAGSTASGNFPTQSPLASSRTLAGGTDAFVAKLNPAGSSLVYSTFLGGSAEDIAMGIAVDAAGNAHVTGSTLSTNFPTANAWRGSGAGGRDAFVAKVNLAGSALLYSTYLGGDGEDQVYGIALDGAGNAYVAGVTQSSNFPRVAALQDQPAGQADAFLARLSSAGTELVFATYLGGRNWDTATALAVDAAGVLVVTGTTRGEGFPVTAGAPYSAIRGLDDLYVLRIADLPGARPRVSTVSAASFGGPVLAAESIAAAFGTDLAASTEVASSTPLPTTLGGATVLVTDSAGSERPAPLFFVSPGQINFLIPPQTAAGAVTVNVRRGDRVAAAGAIRIEAVAPALFSANASGRGVAAALALRVAASGAQSVESIFQCGGAGACTATPIDPGPESDQVFLLLFGTGIRGRSSASAVRVTMGGETAEVLGAGAQGQFVGLDQVNVRLPRALLARGEVDIVVTVDGKLANVVTASVGGTLPPPRITTLAPAGGETGRSIADFAISGQNLRRVTAIEFSPPEGITVSNLSASDGSVTARVNISFTAAVGPRSVTVVSPAGRSNALPFEVRQGPPPPSGLGFFPLRTGLKWTYRVTFPETVRLPYQPIFEVPAGLICASVFCGGGNWNAGQIEFEMTILGPTTTPQGEPAWQVEMPLAGRRFFFFLPEPNPPERIENELRLSIIDGDPRLDLIAVYPVQTPPKWRLVRPLVHLRAADLAERVAVTVPAGEFRDAARSTLRLVGEPPYVSGTFTTEIHVAAEVGIVKAVMRDSASRVLYTMELVSLSGN